LGRGNSVAKAGEVLLLIVLKRSNGLLVNNRI
jgi:hypothetical protein